MDQTKKKNVKSASMKARSDFNNFLLTENEVVTGKSQTETLSYWPSDSVVSNITCYYMAFCFVFCSPVIGPWAIHISY